MNAPVIAGTGRRRVRFHVLRVGEVQRLCDDAVAVRFEVPDQLAEAFAFRPGQSLTLRRYVDGSEYRRSYSICAGLGERPRIGVRSVPDGVVSDWLVRDLRPGDEIEVAEPSGGFVPDLAVDERHVCIAAGSGITPVLSVTSSVLRHTRGSVTLLYGNRRTDTVMFADDLADLKDEFPERLELIHVLSREPRDAELFTGRMDADKIRAVLSRVVEPRDVDQWWLCGPYPMVRDTQTVLREHEIDRSRIHRELFFVDEQPPATRHHADPPCSEAASEVTVLLDGRATTTSVPHTSPLLDGVQPVRPDLPFACKGGVCGTCRAKVISGNVRMRRNFALEPEEVDAGFVLTCQSLPLSESVRVDYDA